MATQRTEAPHAPVDAAPRSASTYWLDADDRVVRVNRVWRAFAEANDAPTLPALVIGHQIWEFVGGTHLRQLLRELFDHVRRSGRPIRVDYRCDSPSVVRTFSLHLQPTENGGLECASELIAELHRSPLAVLDAAHPRDVDHVIALCSWCKRAHVGEWVELDEAVRLLGLLREEPAPVIAHSLCPSCDHALRGKLE